MMLYIFEKLISSIKCKYNINLTKNEDENYFFLSIFDGVIKDVYSIFQSSIGCPSIMTPSKIGK